MLEDISFNIADMEEEKVVIDREYVKEKFEEKINPLITGCLQLLSDDPLFFIINTYTTGYSSTVMYNTLNRYVEENSLGGKVISDEIGINIKDTDYVLPCGQSTRWYK